VLPVEGDSLTSTVLQTGEAGRLDTYEGIEGEIARRVRDSRYHSVVAAPVVVGGRIWGLLVVATQRPEPLEAGAETRLESFAELVALELASAEARNELAASRARLVEAGDTARRRLERDLHDGAQQRLVAVALGMRLARAKLDKDPVAATELLEEAGDQLDQGLEQLRELARGIHPALLTDRGLQPALAALASRAPFPVGLDVPAERFTHGVEVAVYYLVSEALTNAAKYAQPSTVCVSVEHADGVLRPRSTTTAAAAPIRPRARACAAWPTASRRPAGYSSQAWIASWLVMSPSRTSSTVMHRTFVPSG
jgi:signal transduction histidine kinase